MMMDHECKIFVQAVATRRFVGHGEKIEDRAGDNLNRMSRVIRAGRRKDGRGSRNVSIASRSWKKQCA